MNLPTRRPRPRVLVVTSRLCWLAGFLLLLTSFMVLIPVVMLLGTPSAYVPAYATLVLAAGYCLSGYLVARARRFGGLTAILTATTASALLLKVAPFAGREDGLLQIVGFMATAGLGLNLTIIVLVVFTWRHFRPLRRQVGA